MKYFNFIFFFLLLGTGNVCAQEQDSVIVVKGQVSDYYIPVSKNIDIEGFTDVNLYMSPLNPPK